MSDEYEHIDKAQRLRRLKIAAVDLVDKGAQGDHVGVRIFKNAEGAGMSMKTDYASIYKSDVASARNADEAHEGIARRSQVMKGLSDEPLTDAQAYTEYITDTVAGQAEYEDYLLMQEVEKGFGSVAKANGNGDDGGARLLGAAIEMALNGGVLEDAPDDVRKQARTLVGFLAEYSVASGTDDAATAKRVSKAGSGSDAEVFEEFEKVLKDDDPDSVYAFIEKRAIMEFPEETTPAQSVAKYMTQTEMGSALYTRYVEVMEAAG